MSLDISHQEAHTRDMSAAHLTEESVFPITRKWSRISSPTKIGITSGDYEIISGQSQFGSYPVYHVRHNRKSVGTFTSQKEAKVAVEKHDAGFSTCVFFMNIEKWDK